MNGKNTRPLYLPSPYQDAAHQGRMILRDGSTAFVRPATADDRDALAYFFTALSPESRRFRFFSEAKPGADTISACCDSADPGQGITLLAFRTVDSAPRIIAAASYIAQGEVTAEFAVAVDDAYHGKGLGGMLFERLALLAAVHGFTHFVAFTDPANRAMLDVFRHSGFAVKEDVQDDCVRFDIAVEQRPASVAHSEMRDRVYTAASLRPFFKPSSVAVVGASRQPGAIGHRILDELVKNRFNGPVYPVNPKADVVCCMRAYPSVRDLPQAVDLAVIAVPKNAVLDVVDDCAARGVRSVVVISAGFAEAGGEGRELQRRLVEKVRGHGMRLVGPNCLGLINTHPDVRLGASFSPVFPPHGGIAMSSQSGALGIAILELATKRNLGLSTFISVGNKADVTGNDLLQYWEEDPDTDVILLYLESFGNPRRFARIARRVSRKKPIVCVKSGRTSAGSRAAGSHTAALAASDVAVDALFQQAGVIRADTLEEMFDLAATLAHQPLPRGNRVGIVTNAGGPGILCADALDEGGMQVPGPSADTCAKLREFLPAAASVDNPVDMLASAPPGHFRRTTELMLLDENTDALAVIYIPVGAANNDAIMQAIGEGVAAGRASGARQKPVVVIMMTEQCANVPIKAGGETLPRYLFPESAARVLARLARYAAWRERSVSVYPDFEDCRPNVARDICRGALASRGEGWLTGEEARAVLDAFRMPVPAGGIARTAEDAVTLANQIGYPVALKLDSVSLVHKTEVGGIKLNLADAAAVRGAFAALRDDLQKAGKLKQMNGALVQPMIRGGVETMVGVVEDSLFGPLIAFGLGGVHVEVLRDVVFRITPLSEQDAREMVTGIRGYKLLQGYRGQAPADTEALVDLLLRVSLLVEEIPEISTLDMNPVFTRPPGEGCSIADVRIFVSKVRESQPVRLAVGRGQSAAIDSAATA
jgi:acetyl coenzyme A synthetase (ADP forming)-like protein